MGRNRRNYFGAEWASWSRRLWPPGVDLVEPRLQAALPEASEAVERAAQVVQFRADPADDFENRGVLRIEVGEVDDALVMKDAVAKIADAFPAGVEFDHVALGAGSVRESLLGQIVSEAATGVDLVKKSGPETEAQFGDHPARCHWLFAVDKILAGFTDAELLPEGSRAVAVSYQASVP